MEAVVLLGQGNFFQRANDQMEVCDFNKTDLFAVSSTEREKEKSRQTVCTAVYFRIELLALDCDILSRVEASEMSSALL